VWRRRVTDQKWGDDKMQFVYGISFQEKRVHRAAAFDHEAFNAPVGEAGQEQVHVERAAGVDHRRPAV
jgi:hypothetical protein